jgi:hypothetical protein
MTQQRHSSDDGSLGIDAQLRKALDHAPDARLEPPAALDQTILHAARLAARTSKHQAPPNQPAASEGLGARLREWWQRPTAVPALAVLVLATVVVSMWSQQPIPPALEKSPPETSTGNLEAGATVMAEAAPSPPLAASALAKTPSPPPVPSASRPAPASKLARNEVIAAETTARSESKASSLERMADAATEGRREQETLPAPISPAATAAPAAPAAPALAFNAQGAGAASQSTEATRRTRSLEATPSDRLAQIVANSARWSWRQDRSQQNTAIDRVTSEWLARLARITAGRWTRLSTKTDAASAATPMELWQLHELHATIFMGDKSVDWIDRDGSTWRAALTPEEVTGLRR